MLGHFSLFAFSTPYSDERILLEYASKQDWFNAIKLLNDFPVLQQRNLEKLLNLAWKQKHIGAYHSLIKMFNRLHNIEYAPLESQAAEMLIAAQYGDWENVINHYQDGDEMTLKDEFGLTLTNYAHLYECPNIFNQIKAIQASQSLWCSNSVRNPVAQKQEDTLTQKFNSLSLYKSRRHHSTRTHRQSKPNPTTTSRNKSTPRGGKFKRAAAN